MKYGFKAYGHTNTKVEYGRLAMPLGHKVYQNDLDYCLIKDYIDFAHKGQIGKVDAEGFRCDAILATNREELSDILEAIYRIQDVSQSDAEAYKESIKNNLPCEIAFNRDVLSKDFQKELWFAGEFIEQQLASSADYFMLDEPIE